MTVGSAEVFRDEAVDFASRIWRDGGECELLVVPGGTHSYVGAAPDSSITKLHQHVVEEWMDALFHPDDPAGAGAAIEQLEPLEKVYSGQAEAPDAAKLKSS